MKTAQNMPSRLMWADESALFMNFKFPLKESPCRKANHKKDLNLAAESKLFKVKY